MPLRNFEDWENVQGSGNGWLGRIRREEWEGFSDFIWGYSLGMWGGLRKGDTTLTCH